MLTHSIPYFRRIQNRRDIVLGMIDLEDLFRQVLPFPSFITLLPLEGAEMSFVVGIHEDDMERFDEYYDRLKRMGEPLFRDIGLTEFEVAEYDRVLQVHRHTWKRRDWRDVARSDYFARKHYY